MRSIVTVLSLSLCLCLYIGNASTIAAEKADPVKCKAIKKEIRNVRSKMRAGYTRAQGERLEAKLRKLRKARFKNCR